MFQIRGMLRLRPTSRPAWNSWMAQRRCIRLQKPHHLLPTRHSRCRTSPWVFYPTCAIILGTACFATYQTSQSFRHIVFAVVRCSRVAGQCFSEAMPQAYNCHLGAAILSAVDYKLTMVKSYKSVDEEGEAYSGCHTRSAQRVLKALLANGGLAPFNICQILNLCDPTNRCFYKNGTAYSFISGPSGRVDEYHENFAR